MYDKINVNVRGLEALGVKASQYGRLLIPVVMSKLQQDIRLQIARKTSKEVWEISKILYVIRNEVEAREISDSVKVVQLHKSCRCFVCLMVGHTAAQCDCKGVVEDVRVDTVNRYVNIRFRPPTSPSAI